MLSTFVLFETISIENQLQHCIENLDLFLKKIDLKNIMWSPKIDGVRVRIIIDKRTIKEKNDNFRKIASIKYFSRNGKEFKNFNIDDDITEIGHILNRDFGIKYPIMLDMEVTGMSHDIYSVMTQLRRIKNVDPSIFRFYIFDIVLDKSLEHRQRLLELCFSKYAGKIQKIPFYYFSDFSLEKLNDLVDELHKKGFEGLILFDKNSTYNYGRTVACCKCKKFRSIELRVIGVKSGTGKYSNSLGAFIVEYKGKKISVSGRLSDEEREYYYKHPPIGKIIEIQYQEETPNGYLRKPTFIRFRPDKK